MDGDEWLDVAHPDGARELSVTECSLSAVTEMTTTSSSGHGTDDDTAARSILDAPFQSYPQELGVASAALSATAALSASATMSRRMSRGLTRGIKCASSMRRRMRTSKLRVPTYVTAACTRAAVGHVMGTLIAPAISVPWRIAAAVADNQYVAVGACAATLLAAALVWWPRCVSTHTGGART